MIFNYLCLSINNGLNLLQPEFTIAHWFTPEEQDIHGNGLTPDIEAPHPTDTPVDQDPQRERAIEYLLQGQ